MEIIELDAAVWKTVPDFGAALKAALGSPDWHGSKPVAFVDSMIAGGVNERKPPYVIRIVNSAALAPEVLAFIRDLSLLVEETRARRLKRTGENVAVSIQIAN